MTISDEHIDSDAQKTRGDRLGDMMRAAMAGDSAIYAQALKEIAGRARTAAGAMLRRGGRGLEDLEDIVQETLLAVHLKRDTWDQSRPFEPWLAAVVRYKLIDTLRRRRMGHVPIDDLADVLPAQTSAPSDVGDVERTLTTLDERQQTIVRAIAMEGRSAAEVGRDLGMKEGAVRVALHRALKTLATRFRKGQS